MQSSAGLVGSASGCCSRQRPRAHDASGGGPDAAACRPAQQLAAGSPRAPPTPRSSGFEPVRSVVVARSEVSTNLVKRKYLRGSAWPRPSAGVAQPTRRPLLGSCFFGAAASHQEPAWKHEESVRVKTGLFCSILMRFRIFLSLQRLQHKKVLVAHMDRHQVPHLWRGNNLFILQPLQR